MILADGERQVGTLRAETKQTTSSMSQHLALLRHSDVVIPRRQGRMIYYSLTDVGQHLARVVNHVIA